MTVEAGPFDNASTGCCYCCCCRRRGRRDQGAQTRSSGFWLRRAFKKCLGIMRQKLNANRKMLSVVSAGAAAGMGGMDRLRGGGRGASQELAASRERQLRLHNLRTDQTLNLPPSISLPDGEEYRATYASSTAATLQLRDAEQESEIYQKCIRAPPNRTVMESESPPPYRSSSTVILPSCSSSSGNSDWSSSGSGFVRSHSMSSTSSSVLSKTGTSNHHHHHQQHHASQGGQKTDFRAGFQRIFNGKKTTTATSSSTSATTPCVIVPTTQPRHHHHHQQQQQHHHQQQQQQQRKDTGLGYRPPV